MYLQSGIPMRNVSVRREVFQWDRSASAFQTVAEQYGVRWETTEANPTHVVLALSHPNNWGTLGEFITKFVEPLDRQHISDRDIARSLVDALTSLRDWFRGENNPQWSSIDATIKYWQNHQSRDQRVVITA